MLVRLTYLGFLPGKADEAKKIYNEEIIPVVKQQQGNLDCKLLEPVKENEDFISLTSWESKEDADAYHTSGVYKKLVERFKDLYVKEPVLKVYSTQSLLQPA